MEQAIQDPLMVMVTLDKIQQSLTQKALEEKDLGQLSRSTPNNSFNGYNNPAISFGCEVCGGIGCIVQKDENGREFARECTCLTVYKNERRIAKSGLSNAFKYYTFDKYKTIEKWQKDIKDKAFKFLKDPGYWFYIGGAVGSGKSHLCTAICGQLIKTKSVHYMPWRDEIVRIKANVTNDIEYQKLTYSLKTIDVLYIDDFFKGSTTEADHNIAFEVLNYRYLNRLTTLISSEHYLENFIDVNNAVGSRIFQMTKAGEYLVAIERGVDNERNFRFK